tara:strand:- start:845 stop:1828 length:984 start_codon:yes stop_codon:yes gene_type:complete
MILKSFEVSKKEISSIKLFLVYGENQGLKKEIIDTIKLKHSGKEIKFEETQILTNKLLFFNEIKNRSLFDENKIYLIERCTEKISDIVFEVLNNKIDDLIIINCANLEKKSKLRNFVEKSANAVIIPTYKDNSQSLVNIAKTFFIEKKIDISYETINLLVSRCNGDRGNLKQELKKISNYITDKKIITLKEISILTNLSENYSASELVDASLSKNLKKTQEILDENNYSQEDTFLVLRVFLHKTKKILNLIENIDKGTNIEKVIADYKPPIFWKDKPIIKKQLQLWSFKTINELIYKLNDIELKVKKNNTTSLILMKNFIYEIAASN